MAIDHETPLSTSIIIDNNKALLKKLTENNISIVGEKENKKKPQLWFNDDVSKISAEEYYFEDDDCSIHYSGVAHTIDGEVYLSFDLPISDVVLVDILSASIKRLNKLKTALETLK